MKPAGTKRKVKPMTDNNNTAPATLTRAERKAANKAAHAQARALQVAAWEAAKAAKQAARAERVATGRAAQGMTGTALVAPAPAPVAPATVAPDNGEAEWQAYLARLAATEAARVAPITPAPVVAPAPAPVASKPAKAAKPAPAKGDAVPLSTRLRVAQETAMRMHGTRWDLSHGQMMKVPGGLRGHFACVGRGRVAVLPSRVVVPAPECWPDATLPECFAGQWRADLAAHRVAQRDAERAAQAAQRDAVRAALAAKPVKVKRAKAAKPAPVVAPAKGDGAANLGHALAALARGMARTVHAPEG